MLQPLFRYYGPQASGITSFSWAPNAPLLALSTISDQIQLWDLSSRSLLRSWPAPASSHLTWSSDGSLLLSSSGHLWDPFSGQLLSRLPDHPSPSSLSPDGSLLASYSRPSHALLLWESHRGLFLYRLPHPRPISAFSWSPDGSLLASTTEGLLNGSLSIESQLQLWDPSSGSLLRSWPASSLPPLSWSPDGSLLLTTVGDLWDSRTGQLLLRLPDHAPAPISALVWSPDGSLIALGHKDGSLSLWHLPSNQLLLRLSAPSPSPISALAWSPDGSFLASASTDGSLSLWRISSGHLLDRLSLPSSSSFALTWSYDSSFLACASSPNPQAYSSSALLPPLQEYSVTVWHTSSKQPFLSFPASAHHFTTALWLPNTPVLAIGDQAGFLHLWHPSSGQPPLLLHAHSQPISALACSPDGSLLASASEDHTVAIWHTPSGRLLRRYTSHSYKVVALAWSPDGSRIASADDEGLIHLWNPLTGKTLLTKPFEHECWSPSLAWSPDGSRLAVTAWSDLLPPTISIWQADTFQPLLHYYGHHHDIYAVSWSPDGSLIASLSSDSPNDPPASSILHLWDPSSGRLLHRWPCHAFLAPVWSPDGSLLAFEGLQGLEIRSVRPGLPLLFLPASSPCAWSPDGSLLASLSPFSVDLWPVSTLLS